MTLLLIAVLATPALVATLVWAGLLVPLRAMKANAEESSSEARTIPVVVAKHPLYAGIPIRPEDVVVRLVDGQSVPTGPEGQPVVFASVEEVDKRVPRERILQHEPIRIERLARRDAGEGLSAVVTPGKRAVTLNLSASAGLDGLIQPGDQLDLALLDASGGCTWVQVVEVLAVNGELRRGTASAGDGSPVRVTIEAMPDEAATIAASGERVRATLRSPIDIVSAGERVGPCVAPGRAP